MVEAPYGCTKCRARLRLFTTLVTFKTTCKLPPLNFTDGIETLDTSFSGEYYAQRKNSVSKLTIPLNGTYAGYNIEKGLKISVTIVHEDPITINRPLYVKSCTTKVGSSRCLCSRCNDGAGFAVNCTNVILIPKSTNGSPTDIMFPETNENCFSPIV